MMKRNVYKVLPILLTAVMVLNMGFPSVFAKGRTLDESGLTQCHTAHDVDCGYSGSVTTQGGITVTSPCTHSCEQCQPLDSDNSAVKALISMVDALPNAADITDDNKEATISAFGAAAEAYEGLSGEDKAFFDATEQYTKLRALHTALYATVPLTSEPVTLDISKNYVKITETGYKVGSEAEKPYIGDYILTGTAIGITDSNVYDYVLVSGGTHNITLKDANIKLTESNQRAFVLEEKSTVNLTLEGTNILQSAKASAVRVPTNNTLNITNKSTGSLIATSSEGEAGIGGAYREAGGNITINGGTVTAISNGNGAGIGGGSGSEGGKITISGGTVTATGNGDGAGIGGGSGSKGVGGEITISGGTVTAKGGGGAGIGGGQGGAGGKITISGGTITATGGVRGAGIGGGGGYNNGGIVGEGGAGGDIKINGNAVVFATGGTLETNDIGAGLNGANGTVEKTSGIIFEGTEGLVYGAAVSPTNSFTIPVTYRLTIDANKTVIIDTTITLENKGTIINQGIIRGNVSGIQPIDHTSISKNDMIFNDTCDSECKGHVVTGSTETYHIIVESGSHDIVLSGVSIDVSNESGKSALEMRDKSTINLTLEGDNTLKSGANAAGLQVPQGATLTIPDTSAGSLTAIGGSDSAGIGGGNNSASGKITINKSLVYANGAGGGAGIGGGNQGNSSTIDISGDAIVFARMGESGGKHIGAGQGGTPGSVKLGGGIVFEGDEGQVRGDRRLQRNLTIGQEQTLTIMKVNSALVVPEDYTLTNNGKIENDGALYILGIPNGEGMLSGEGMVQVPLTDSMVTLDKGSYVFTGNPIEPTVTVKLTLWQKALTFTKGTDYDLSCFDNIAVSENAKVTVKATNKSALTGVEGVTKTFSIHQADTEFIGGVRTYKGSDLEDTFAYGDTITVKVTPATADSARKSRTLAPPTGDQMALFQGDKQLTEPKDAENGQELEFTIDTGKKDLSIGEHTITAKYVAGTNMTGHSEDATVTLTQKPLTATIKAKAYDGNVDFRDAVLIFNEVVKGDRVTATANGTADNAAVGTGKSFTTQNVTPLQGEDAPWYSLDLAGVSNTVDIYGATPTVEVTAEKKTSFLRSIIGDHNDTIMLKATIKGANDEKPDGLVVFKNGEQTLGTKTTTNGVATCEWDNPSANDNITITAEFTANSSEGNYSKEMVKGTCKFGIKKGTQADLTVNVPELAYGDTGKSFSTAGGSTDGIVSYQVTEGDCITVNANTGAITEVKVGTAKVTATMAGNTDYKEVTSEQTTITVSPAIPTFSWGDNIAQTVTYTGAPIEVSALTQPIATGVSGGTNPSGAISYQHKSTAARVSNGFGLLEGYTAGLPTDAGEYKIVATIAAEGNYLEKASDEMTLTIEQSTPKLLIGSDYTDKDYDGKAIDDPTKEQMTITGAAYEDVKFAYSANREMSDPSETPPTIAGTYYVQARVGATNNTKAATSEVALFEIAKIVPDITVKTDKTGAMSGKDIVVTVKIINPIDATSGFPKANEIAIAPTNATLKSAMTEQDGTYTATYTLDAYRVGLKAKFTATVPSDTTNYKANTMGITSQEVEILDQYLPIVAIAADHSTVNYGDSVTLTATVDRDGKTSSLAGTVQFKLDETPVGEAVAIDDVSGKANFTVANKEKLTVNGSPHSFTAEFIPALGSDYKGNTSAACAVTVNKAEPSGTVTITGTTKFGKTLTADTSALTGIDDESLGGFIYQWKNADSNIGGATSDTYVVKETDLKKAITVTVTPGGSNYSEKTSGAVTPAKADSIVEITGDPTKIYDGQAAEEPAISQTGSNGAVTFEWYEGETKLDFAPKDSGSYTVKALLAATSTHEAAVSEKNFTITPKEIMPTIDEISPVTYDGVAKEPDLTVKDGDGDTLLVNDVDYTAAYSDNLSAGIDTGKVEITLKGNYEGTANATFTINKASGLIATTPSHIPMVKGQKKDYTFDLSTIAVNKTDTGAQTYALGTLTNNNAIFETIPNINGNEMSFTSSIIANAATNQATQVVTISSQNYEDATVTLTFDVIDKKPVTITGLTEATNLVYDGSSQKGYTGTAEFSPEWMGTLDYTYYIGAGTGGTKLAGAPTNAGTYTVVGSIPDSDATYEGRTSDMTFTIEKKEVTVKADDQSMIKGGTLPTFTVTYIGFVGEENANNAALDTPAIANCMADGITVGTFDITLSTQAVLNGDAGKNYNITDQNKGTLTVSETIHTITASAGTGGTISPSGAVAVTDGANQTFTISADGSYSIADVTVDGVNQGAVSTYIFSNVTGNHTISATFSDNGGGGGGGSAPNPTPPETDTTLIPEVDKEGNATVTISEKNIEDAIKKAQDEGKKDVIMTLDTKKESHSFTANLPKSVQEKLIDAGVSTFTINGGATITFDLEAIKQITATANTDVTVTATKTANSALSKEAQAATSGRPVYDFKVTGGSKSITNFGNGKLALSIPYELQKVDGNGKPSDTGSFENPGNLVGVYINANGELAYLPGSSYNAASKTMLITTTHLSVYGVAYKTNAPTFTDTATHWAKDDIQFVAIRGLLTGTTATTFSPNTSMTRGMFVTALGRLAGIDTNSYKTSSFTDVAAGSYYLPYAQWAVKNNIVTGTSATTFAPDRAITRQEMAVMTANYAKAIGYKLPSVHNEIVFTDSTSIDTWAKSAVKEMQMAGILMGKDGGKFDPTGTATRAEVSAMLRRFVELVANS